MKFLALVAALVPAALATSSGLEVTVCDARSPLLGCDPANWYMGNRLNCTTVGQIMWWSSKPVATAAYKLVAGSESNPATQYTPGKLIDVHVRVTEYGMLYRGIMLYAQDSKGNTVGEWNFPVEDPPLFRHSLICPSTVMHASAQLKPYHTVLKFLAPDAGTGPVTFRCIIKQGDANTGALYWPNAEATTAAGDLTLTEGAVPAPAETEWLRTERGQTCSQRCAEATRLCDGAQLTTAVTSGDDIDTLIGDSQPCKLPYLSSCRNLGPTSSVDDLCYFQLDQASCQSQGRTYVAPTCDTKSDLNELGRRLCPCVPLPDDGVELTGCSGCKCNADNTCNSVYNQCTNGVCARAPNCAGLPGCKCLANGQCSHPSLICDSIAGVCREAADSGRGRGCPGCSCANNEECESPFAPVCLEDAKVCIAQDCVVGRAGCACSAAKGCDLGGHICYKDICIKVFGDEQASAAPGAPALASSLASFAAAYAASGSGTAALLAAALPLARAHNWVNSLSRSMGASTTIPCKPKQTDAPVSQVGPNQTFQVEWMTAHGRDVYFAVVHASNEDKLKFNSADLFDEYLEACPPGAGEFGMNTGRWAKFHRKDGGKTSLMIGSTGKLFEKQVKPGDADYLPRPDVFAGDVYSSDPDPSEITMFQYMKSETTDDAFCAYENPRMPWLEAVHRYSHEALQGRGPDMTNIAIPGRAGTGRYIVHYTWSGYYDCIDVDYQATQQISNIYGLELNEDRWTRIDHCAFEDPQMVYGTCMEVVGDDVSACIAACEAQSLDNCWGVMVAPAKAQPTPTAAGFGTVDILPWNGGSCDKADFAAKPANTMVCVALKPRKATDTEYDITLTLDPADPVFYSTCHYRSGGRVFVGDVPPVSISTKWRYNEYCIGCDVQKRNNATTLKAPFWEIADPTMCRNCDIEGK